jgi:5-formyltetrahydrofolate cyclo-ligase
VTVSLPDIKKAARAASAGRRALAHGQADAALANRRLVAHVLSIPVIDIVSAYAAMRTEIDPAPAMVALHEAGLRLCLPVISGRDLPLRFREWRPGCRMEDGPFGASVPASGTWLEPELVIAPLLAFDRHGFRLGYGGGFYDRTLDALRAQRRTYAIGFAYAAQEMSDVPHDRSDQRLDAVVTDREVIHVAR